MDAAAAQTAFGPMVICAIDQFEAHPLITDELAARMLPWAGRAVVALAKWRPLRGSIQRRSEKRLPGVWANMLCRKHFIDDQVLDAVAEDASTVVVLGAGLDTRAYRLPELAGVRVFEVDQPINVDRKRARLLALFGAVPEHVTLVPIDFQTDDLAGSLASAGYRADERTVFVWEGVTQYLTDAGIDATGRFLASAAPGSRLVFTYVQENFLTGQELYGAPAAYLDFVAGRKLWRFGLAPAKVGDFLARYGWRELAQAGAVEYTAHYLEPAGRALPTTDLERAVYAVKAD